MSVLQAIILGLVQGITEFLPISSSAHLTLTSELLNWPEQSLTFDVFLHGATFIAIVYYFRKKIITIARSIFKNNPNYSNTNHRLLINMILTSIPAALLYFIAESYIDTTFKSLPAISLMLIAFGIPLVYINYLSDRFGGKTSISNISALKAYNIGVFQALALIRGVSRSGATLIGGILAGLSKKEALEYAFLAGIPVIFAGFMKELLEFLENPAAGEGIFLISIGSLTALITGFFALKFLMQLIESDKFRYFGFYRIILGVIILIYYYA